MWAGREYLYAERLCSGRFYLCRWSENKEREMGRSEDHDHQVVVHGLEWDPLLFLLSLSVSQPLDVSFCVLASILLSNSPRSVPNYMFTTSLECKFPTSTSVLLSFCHAELIICLMMNTSRFIKDKSRDIMICSARVLLYLLSYFYFC